jgi:two-component system chemotaxis response regulator CheB
MPRFRVLIVDDAVVVRRLLIDALSAEPDLEVFTAPNGRIALSKLPMINPDLVTLDMEMPEMGGIETLKELRRDHPNLPVIMFSTLTERGAASTLDALAAGANDYVTKPSNSGSVEVAIARIKLDLIPKIRLLCGLQAMKESWRATASAAMPAPAAPVVLPESNSPPRPIEVVAIGVSTGGPNALSEMLPMLPRMLPVPVVIVQHMPAVFTKLLADRLAGQCAMKVREGADATPLVAGEVVIAPGGFHMVVKRTGNGLAVELNTAQPENSCRPAVDPLFRSAVAACGGGTMAVVLTGMGSDGLRGCEHVREAGGRVVVQDEASSVVWGMPGFVAKAGLANRVLPLKEIAGEIVRAVNSSRIASVLAVAS